MLDLRPRFIEKLDELLSDDAERDAATKAKNILSLKDNGTITEFECETKLRELAKSLDERLMTRAQCIGLIGGHNNL